MNICRALLFLSLLPWLAVAHAQEPADPNQPLPEASNTEEADADVAPPPAAREGSPFEYEASEQISEDLSVSFPVDI